MTGSEWCLITGVASGLGRACLEEASRLGFCVIGIDIDESEIGLLPNQFPHGRFFCMDVRDTARFDELINSFREEGLEIKIAVLAAGIGFRSSFLELPNDRFVSTLEVNLIARVSMSRILFHYMNQTSGGRIVLISSSSGLAPLKFFAAYSASNAALLSFGRAWSSEIDSTNVRVTTVVPSGMKTNFQLTAGANSTSRHLLDPSFVAKKLFQSHKPVLLVGRSAKWTNVANRLLPRKWVDAILARAVSVFT